MQICAAWSQFCPKVSTIRKLGLAQASSQRRPSNQLNSISLHTSGLTQRHQGDTVSEEIIPQNQHKDRERQIFVQVRERQVGPV